ncbi:MAG: alanine--tRNA ligase-related protein, partial [Halobacteriaceae archaeon]
MTVSSGPTNPYIREFETTIEGINNRDVILEETYFYPQGGGQPADKGYIGSHNVIDVSKNKSNVIHTLEDTPTFAAGDTITCEIDNTFRTYCMRAHTASHALYGAARQELDNLGYGGFDIDETKVRVDFETTSEIDDDTLTELERLVNSVVWESRDVMWREI